MGQISATHEYTASPDEVWAIVSDPNTYEKWNTLHQKWKSDIPAEVAEGTTFTEVISMMGMPNTITWNVDELEAPSRMVISGEGMAGVKVELGFTVAGGADACTLEMSCSFEGQMIVGALGKAIEKQGAAEVQACLDNIAELV